MGLAATVLKLSPGGSFSGTPHKHLNQEELFYVTERTTTWATKAEVDEDPEVVEVGSDEAIYFEPEDLF